MKHPFATPSTNAAHLATQDLTVPQAMVTSSPVELAYEKNNEGNNQAPTLIQIFPKGPEIKTIDGRKFKLSDPEKLAASLNAGVKPIMIDYDHRSHFMPDDGGSQKAAGWMTSFEARNGALWAKVEWTATAASKISDREYRYLSPEFKVSFKTNEVTNLLAAALVNRPALNLVALAQSNPKTDHPENEEIMKNEIAKALGLKEDATQEEILAAVQKKDDEHKTQLASITAKAKTPSTDDFMPRADYDATLARAQTAETKLKTAEEAGFKDEVNTVLAQAVKDGKITPGSKDHYTALCGDKDQLAKVVEAIGASPAIVSGSGITGKPDADKSHLTAEEKSIVASLGISEDDFSKQRAIEAGN